MNLRPYRAEFDRDRGALHMHYDQPSRGMGDVSTCGADPCGLWDWIYTTDACLSFLGCSNPNDPRYVGATKGLLYTVGQSAGQAISAPITGLFSGLNIWGTVALVAVGGFMLASFVRDLR